MAFTRGESATTLQTTGDAYATAFDDSLDGVNPASIVKVENVADGWVVRINGTREIVITAGSGPEYIRSVAPGGIHTIELKNLTGGVNATGYWATGIAV